MGEAACDARTVTFLACIQAVRDQTPGGFGAVKLTALGDPILLKQLATCVRVSEFTTASFTDSWQHCEHGGSYCTSTSD